MKSRNMKSGKWIQGLMALSLVLFLAFHVQNQVWAKSKDHYLNLQLFAKVMNLVQKYYVEEVDTKKLIYGGIKGMLQALDPHTSFLSPETYAEFDSETSGEFGGMGIEITIQDGIVTIISPIEDTPAWKAGLQSGDKIVSVDGKSTKGLSLAETAQLMRGKKDTRVVLGIVRQGVRGSKNYKIKRGVIKIRSVKYADMGSGYGYIRLTSFIETSSRDMKKILKKMTTNKKKIKGLILDLRQNPGGLLDQSIKISDLFLEKGIIVSTIGRDKADKKQVSATAQNSYDGFPMVILINEYSASASEIVAGALKDNKRALIMGKRSFGKGSVQSVIKMEDGSGLKMTVARYYTPNGTSIQAQGITPDVRVDEVDPEAFKKAIINRQVKREADIDGHLANEKKKRKIKASRGLSNWWNQPGKSKENPKKRIRKMNKQDLLHDFQILQAYNYLKAYRVMKNL